jgi:hypothetical protein
MIGRTKLSTIREELRKAYETEGVNPIIELDRKIRDLKKVKSGSDEVLKELEIFREALAEIVEEPKKPARSKRARGTKKAV